MQRCSVGTWVKNHPKEAAVLGEEMDRGVANSYRFYIDTHHKILVDWGFDPREIRLPAKVLVQYAEDDADCPPSHGKFYTEFFRKRCEQESKAFSSHTVNTGFGHLGGFAKFGAWVEAVMADDV